MKDDFSLMTYVQGGFLEGCSPFVSPEWNKWSLLFKVSRSWKILPMSGAHGLGQKPSPLNKTLSSVGKLVIRKIDNATPTICITEFIKK